MNSPATVALGVLLLALLALREILRATVWPRWRSLIWALGALVVPIFALFVGVMAVRVAAALP